MAQKSALGSRPNSFEKKLVGIVDVKVGETKAKFTLVDEKKEFANGTDSIKVNIDDLPVVPAIQKFDGKQLRIRMNSDGDEVEALTPVVGHYRGRLVDLGPRPDGKDSDPTPKEKTFERGEQKNTHLEFFAVYKITSGAFKGAQCPAYNLHYKFENDGSGMTRYAGNPDNKKATRLFQLMDWMALHQLDTTPINWDDVTILPELLKRAEDSDVEVELIFKDGYVREVLPVQDDDDEPDFMKEPVEEPKAKRTEKEIKAELGIEDEDEPKKPVRKAKKVVEDDDDDL